MTSFTCSLSNRLDPYIEIEPGGERGMLVDFVVVALRVVDKFETRCCNVIGVFIV